MQFHEVLHGISIDDQYDDTRNMYANLFALAGKKQEQLIEAVFSPTREDDAVTVFNPNSFPADAYVQVDGRFAGYAVTDGVHTANVLSDGAGNAVFFVKALPGLSSRTYRKTAAVPAEKLVMLKETENGILAETPFFTFTVAADGTLHDFCDKRERIVYSAPEGMNRFVAYKDGPEIEDAWNIDKEYKLRPADMNWSDRLEIVEDNGERAVIRLTKTNGRTTLTQDITLYASIARVDFFSHIDWQEKYKILQVSFPTSIVSPQASYEIAYGVCRRNTHANTPAERWKHEYAAHRFIDLSDDKRGAALLNDCKYGHNVIDGDMIVTLFRSTDYPSCHRDMGAHDFAYAFLPHTGGLSAGRVADQGYLFNSPLLAVPGSFSAPAALSLSDSGMILDCVKPAEDGHGIIVRLYEPYGTSGRVTVTLPVPARITETSPLEEPLSEPKQGKSFDIAYTPFEFRTFRIE
ncbi:MAG: alpha-mannosidase [Clostridia bacterium]|nr:alpha-mannosidase [Clostridia bacterium]